MRRWWHRRVGIVIAMVFAVGLLVPAVPVARAVTLVGGGICGPSGHDAPTGKGHDLSCLARCLAGHAAALPVAPAAPLPSALVVAEGRGAAVVAGPAPVARAYASRAPPRVDCI